MSVGELRASIADVPDDYEVVLDNAEVDDCEISAVRVVALHEAVTTDDPCVMDDDDWCFKHAHEERRYVNAPGLLVLGGGQIISSEYAYHYRLDRWLMGSLGRWPARPYEWILTK